MAEERRVIGAQMDGEYSSVTKKLVRGDIQVLYTDGITEAENACLEMYGEERLRSVIGRSRDNDARELITTILGDVREFCGDHPQSDDITLMVIKVK